MVKINDSCTGCGLCIGDCISEAIFLRDGKAQIHQPCLECGHCYIPSRAVGAFDNIKINPLSKKS